MRHDGLWPTLLPSCVAGSGGDHRGEKGARRVRHRVGSLRAHGTGHDAGMGPRSVGHTPVTAGVAGVYAITVHEAAHRRGFGTAMTWAAVAAGARAGVAAVVLQASDMGRPVYERMGFTRSALTTGSAPWEGS